MTRSRSDSAYHHGDLRRALIEHAMTLVAEEQGWTFSLRELARRAGVSHNAPYNHFADKLELLGAVAGAGFDELGDRAAAAVAGIDAADAALALACRVTIRFGIENPGLYRLMFGPDLAAPGLSGLPRIPGGGLNVKRVVAGILARGARAGFFAVDPDNDREMDLATLTVWSSSHGLTMLLIDNRFARNLAVEDMIAWQTKTLVQGLRGPRRS